MTEMQKQFEEWAITTKDQFGLPFFTMKNEQGKYVGHATEISWQAWQEAWQASRAAVVVKLPESYFGGVDAAEYRDDVIEALGEAGVSYD